MQWHTPLGYGIKNGEIILNEEQMHLVQQIFKAYDSGESAVKIAKDLNEQGVKNGNGRVSWFHGTVGRILENHNYLGTEVYPQIIDDELFKRVNEKRKMTKKDLSCGKYRPAAKERNLFGGVLVCGVCGQRYSHIMPKKTSNSVAKWKCKDYVYKNKVDCGGGFISDEEVMGVCVKAINQIIADKSLIHKVIKTNDKVSLKYREIDKQLGEKSIQSEDEIIELLYKRASERYKTLEIKGFSQYTNEMLIVLDRIAPLKEFDEVLYKKLIKKLAVYRDNSVEVTFINGSSLKIKYGKNAKVQKGESGDHKNSKKGINHTGKTSV